MNTPLNDFTKLLELTGPKLLGLFSACLLLRLANAYGFVSLSDLALSAPAVVDVVMFLSGALTLMWIAESFIHWLRRKLQQRKHRIQIREWLSTLAEDEKTLLQSMLAANRQSMSAHVMNPIIARLVQKGLLLQASGAGSIRAWSYTIPAEVWTEMKSLWRK